MKKADYHKFLLYITMSDKTNHYWKRRDIILHRTKEYYENDEERLREGARS